MKKLFFLLIAMVFAMGSSWAQTLNEGFEGTTFPPDDWTSVHVFGDKVWEQHPNSFGTGLYCAIAEFSSSGSENYLITPLLSVSSASDSISFYLKTNDNYYSGTSFDVMISTTNDSISSFGTTSYFSISSSQYQYPMTWTKYSIPLSAFVGQNIYVAFHVIDQYGVNVLLDNVNGPNVIVPTCPKPRNATSNNITLSTVDLSWINTTSTNFTLQYMPLSSTNWANATTINSITTNSYTISNLIPSSQYQWRVKSVCSDVDESEWSVIKTFSTQCGTITSFPWYESFESNWDSIQFPSNQLSPLCWTVVDKGSDGYSDFYQHWWKRSLNDHHTGNSSASIYTNFGQGDHNDWLITPKVAFVGNEMLKFWAKNETGLGNSYVDEISVFISDTNITLDTVGMGRYGNMTGFTQIFNRVLPMSDWQKYEINLSQYSGDRYIAFVRQHIPEGYTLYIDDVEISEIPLCAHPTNVLVSNVTSTSAEISWTNGRQTDNSWYIFYKPVTSTNYDSVLVTTNPYSISLSEGTIYNLYVTTSCSNIQSESSDTINLATTCSSISSFPYIEGFEDDWLAAGYPGNRNSPHCWTVIDKGTPGIVRDYYWKRAGYASYGTAGSTTHSGLGSAECYTSYGENNHNDWLISPLINFTGNEKLSFWVQRFLNNTSEEDEISVFISDENIILDTTGMGVYGNINGFTQIFNTIVPQGNWRKYDFNLNQYSGNRYIAFVTQHIPNGYYLRLDDVEISTIPSCSNPTTVVASNMTSISADISWQAAQNTDNSWYLYYKALSDTVYDSVLVTENPFTLTGLNPSTTYDIFVSTNCNYMFSSTSCHINFNTLCESISSIPYTMDFDSYGTMTFPLCWSRPEIYYSYQPGGYPLLAHWDYYAHSSTSCIDFQSDRPIYAITPQINIDIQSLKVGFWLRTEQLTAGDMQIGVMSDNSDTSTFELIQNIHPTTTDYTYYEVGFNNSLLSGANNYIAFKYIPGSDGYELNMLLDDVVINFAEGCPNTIDLVSTSTASTEAFLLWNNNNYIGQGWEISYSPLDSANFIADSGTMVTITGNTSFPYAVTSLTPNTQYSFAVRQICNNGRGAWSNIITTFTSGLPATLPYNCGFEDTTENKNWQRLSSTVNNWAIGNAAGNGISGQANDSLSAYMSNNNGISYAVTNGNITSYLYRDIDFGSDTTLASTLSFDWKNYGYASGGSVNSCIVVFVRDVDYVLSNDLINDYPALQNISNDNIGLFYGESAWRRTNILLGNNTGVKRIIFLCLDANRNMLPLAAIDNVKVVQETCQRPGNIVASNITENSADISWNSTSANQYIVSYRKITDVTTTNISATNPNISLQGLDYSTTYIVYIRAICGTDTTLIEFSNHINFTTSCSQTAINEFPYYEGFENGLSCWSQEFVSGSYSWGTTPYYIYLTTYPHEGNKFAQLIEFDTSTTTNKLVSPILDISALAEPYLSYWHIQKEWYSKQGELRVYYRPSTDSAWVELQSFTSDISSWQKDSIALPHQSSTYQIAFEGYVEYDYGVGLDDIKVYDNNSLCPHPINIDVTNIRNTTALVNWSLGGTETSWQVRLGENGANIDVTNTSYQLTGLTAGNTYTVYVRANCGTSYSGWISRTFTAYAGQIAPELNTMIPMNITDSSATLNANYLQGTDTITSQGFEWKLSSSEIWNQQVVTPLVNPYSYSLTGLNENTSYDYRAYVITPNDGITYGDTQTFTTLPIITPTVTTLAVTNIIDHDAIFNGTIVVGTKPIVARGFEYRAISGDTTWIDLSASGTDNITASVTNLSSGSSYKVKAYAQTGTQRYYGNEEPFATTSGLNDIGSNQIVVTLYPNPTENSTKLVVNGVEGNVSIVITDVQGRTINTINAKAENDTIEQIINVTNFAKGVYYIRIINDKFNKTQKLIVK